jgi:hypothetical protein
MATTAVESSRMKNKIDFNNLQTILGHCGEATARMTGKAHDMMLWVLSSLVKLVQLETQDRRI